MKIKDYILWWEMTDEINITDYVVDKNDHVVSVTISNGYSEEVLSL